MEPNKVLQGSMLQGTQKRAQKQLFQRRIFSPPPQFAASPTHRGLEPSRWFGGGFPFKLNKKEFKSKSRYRPQLA